MVKTVGYVGTIEVETRNTARIWFSLTESKDNSDWIKIGAVRAWFTMNVDASDRPIFMAELSLVKDAMRDGLQIEVKHDGVESYHHKNSGDSYTVTGVRILRAPMHF